MEFYPLILWLLTLSLSPKDITSEVKVKEVSGRLILSCGEFGEVKWAHDGKLFPNKTNSLDIGHILDDPRGRYSCKDEHTYIEVYVRMCQYCVELDIGTISGFLVADVIMITLIGVAVYCVSGSEIRRPARASDRQNLLQNDSLYQHLGERQDAAYSRLSPRKM